MVNPAINLQQKMSGDWNSKDSGCPQLENAFRRQQQVRDCSVDTLLSKQDRRTIPEVNAITIVSSIPVKGLSNCWPGWWCNPKKVNCSWSTPCPPTTDPKWVLHTEDEKEKWKIIILWSSFVGGGSNIKAHPTTWRPWCQHIGRHGCRNPTIFVRHLWVSRMTVCVTTWVPVRLVIVLGLNKNTLMANKKCLERSDPTG